MFGLLVLSGYDPKEAERANRMGLGFPATASQGAAQRQFPDYVEKDVTPAVGTRAPHKQP